MTSFPIWAWPILFLTGFAAGFVDAIVGGGGLLSVPVLLGLGMPAAMTLGTNKLQASFGAMSAVWRYGNAGMIRFREGILGVVCTAFGSAVGALLIRYSSDHLLQQVIPFLLLAVALFFLLKPDAGRGDSKPKIPLGVFHTLFGLLLGFYDGFFGPGVGSFWAMAYVLIAGLNLSAATAQTKLMNCTSNLAALAVLGCSGNVLFGPAVVMGSGQILGARAGAGFVISGGVKFIRPVFICVVLAITLRLYWKWR